MATYTPQHITLPEVKEAARKAYREGRLIAQNYVSLGSPAGLFAGVSQDFPSNACNVLCGDFLSSLYTNSSWRGEGRLPPPSPNLASKSTA
ncbi:MAG: hypothetical protein MI920_18080 [Kiloniellales bacterium]|nr:hypothetical protein [Kiloniellales bacterium]